GDWFDCWRGSRGDRIEVPCHILHSASTLWRSSDENTAMKAKQQLNTNGELATNASSLDTRSRVVFRFLRSFSLVLVPSLLLASCKSTADKSSLEVAAKVGSAEITLKRVDGTIKQQLDASGGSPSMTSAELVAARLSVLDNLIQEEALFQKAQKENLVPDDDKVKQEVQKRKQDANLTEEQYQNQIKQAGLTEDEFREKIRRELAINALRER